MGWKQQMVGVAAAASLVVMGGTATAQSSATSGSQHGQHGQTATSGQGQDDRDQGSGADNDIAKFYKKAALGNMAEVQLGKLGAEKAQNPQVKQFAQQMADAHQRALDELKEVASGNHDWPATLDEKHQKAHDKLSGLSGEEFDREFVDAMVDAHEDMEDLLEGYVGENRMGSADDRPGASGTSGMGGTTTGTTTGQTTAGGSTSGSGAGSTSTGAGQSAAGTSGRATSPRLSGAVQDWASKSLRDVRSHLEQAKQLKEQIEK